MCVILKFYLEVKLNYFMLLKHIFFLDGFGNSFLDLDQPSCYLGIYYILFYIFFVLWWDSLVSDYAMS